MGNEQRWPHDDVLHAWWVEPERLLAGEYPSSLTPGKAATKVRLLVDAGIDSIVDLTMPADGLDSYRELLQAATTEAGRTLQHFNYPIPDNGVIDHGGYDRILARIRDEIDSDRVVYVHCCGGKGRTSTVVGCLLIDDGIDYESAIARIAELRAGTRKAIGACPESRSQHEVLRERAARR